MDRIHVGLIELVVAVGSLYPTGGKRIREHVVVFVDIGVPILISGVAVAPLIGDNEDGTLASERASPDHQALLGVIAGGIVVEGDIAPTKRLRGAAVQQKFDARPVNIVRRSRRDGVLVVRASDLG